MRVLHVISSVGPLRGGPSAVIRTMTHSLVRAGLEVHVATTDDNGPDRLPVSCAMPAEEEGVIYWYFRRQTRFYTFSWPLSRWLAQHVREYDLVHIHGLFSYAGIPAAYFASLYEIPYIVRPFGVLNRWGMENRHPWLKKLSFRLIENRILACAAAIHYTSEQERLEATELGVGQRSVIIPNAVDGAGDSNRRATGLFHRRYRQLANRTVILFLSRLDPKKGLDLLLPAFVRVRERHPQTMLVIAGSGDPAFAASLREQAARLGVDSSIVWAGFLRGAEKWAALAEADVFVLPSYSENFGISIVEAMSCGLPVVVSDQVAIHREILDARAGLVVPCATNELEQALGALIGDRRLRAQMGTNGRRLTQTKFSSEVVTENLLALYRKISNPIPRNMELAVS